jgi:hypothetical protein
VINACEECLSKQRIIDKQLEEIVRLKAKLKQEERKATEGYFGSSTPSSQKPIKTNSLEENQQKKGGAKKGHKGHGRKKIKPKDADEIIDVEAPVSAICPDCEEELINLQAKERSVIDSDPPKTKKKIYRLERKMCKRCKKFFEAQAPSVLPKMLYGNQLITNMLDMHYMHGIPMGRLENILDMPCSAMIQIQHRLAKIMNDIPCKLIEEYRNSFVKHADESGWRTDGANGYVWLFANESTSVYKFTNTRSSRIPHEILGSKKLGGVLIVDRYNAYNQSPCAIQYCYAHLLRDLKDLEKDFPDNYEVQQFIDCVAPLLGAAMGLRTQPISDEQYYLEAKAIKKRIMKAMKSDAQNMGIRSYQEIFRKHKKRLYHWASDRRVPADNNRAERDLRGTVIARKVSFGSQSQAGAETRSTLMSIIGTLRKRRPKDYQQLFKSALDEYAKDPSVNLTQYLLKSTHD